MEPIPKGPIIIEVTDTKYVLASQPVDPPIPPSIQAPTLPYPQRLVPATPSKPNPIETDLLDKLKHMIVQISLLDTLKEIPIYSKALKEACIKQTGRKKKEPPTVHIFGKLFQRFKLSTRAS